MANPEAAQSRLDGFLNFIERIGNRLPDPVFLFVGGTLLVIVVSWIGASMGWSVQPVRPVMAAVGADTGGPPKLTLVEVGDPVRPRSLATTQGVYWLIANMVRNFINFAPLGVVLVSVLGIGVAEKVGLFAALMRFLAGVVPRAALTPMMLLLGMLSHLASDAGYIILPPLAGALYAAAGRPPIAGIATAFAGVAGGFAANIFVGSSDALIAPLTERAARLLEPEYTVLPTSNWYFLAASTFVLVGAGWFVTSKIVEPRLARQPMPAAAQELVNEAEVSPTQKRALAWAGISALLATLVFACLIAIPGAPLSGSMPAPAPTFGPIPAAAPENAVLPAALPPRWSQAIVPGIFFIFLVPGIVYGVKTGAVRALPDISKAFYGAMVGMAPVIVMAFFAAQFVEAFRYSNMDAMIANAGGKTLAAANLPPPVLIIAVIVLVIVLDMLIASMSAKWTAMAPILVPMLMMAGLSPELTQVTYRIGDSVVNVVTPLNSYIIVILAAVQRYRPAAGIGNLISLMLPYSLMFFAVWTGFLLLWTTLELPLGPGAPLWYAPSQ